MCPNRYCSFRHGILMSVFCSMRVGTMTCPHCGVRFNNTETYDRAFIEEEDFEDWMDEEEGL